VCGGGDGDGGAWHNVEYYINAAIIKYKQFMQDGRQFVNCNIDSTLYEKLSEIRLSCLFNHRTICLAE